MTIYATKGFIIMMITDYLNKNSKLFFYNNYMVNNIQFKNLKSLQEQGHNTIPTNPIFSTSIIKNLLNPKKFLKYF